MCRHTSYLSVCVVVHVGVAASSLTEACQGAHFEYFQSVRQHVGPHTHTRWHILCVQTLPMLCWMEWMASCWVQRPSGGSTLWSLWGQSQPSAGVCGLGKPVVASEALCFMQVPQWACVNTTVRLLKLPSTFQRGLQLMQDSQATVEAAFVAVYISC